MKKRIINTRYVVLLVLFLPISSFAQEWGGTKPIGFWDHWSINVNAGLNSYFGDLSYYDTDINGKISNESGFGLGGLLTKHVTNKFSISGELLLGDFKGGNTNNNSFKTKFFEYSLQVRLDLIRVFISNSNPKFGIEGFAGLGQLWFNVAHKEYNEGNPISSEYKSSSPEFIYYAGLGMHYHVAERIAISSSFSLRQIKNDRFDNLVKNNDFDLYSYLSVGLTYYFSGWGSSFTKKKGSSVAHSGIRS